MRTHEMRQIIREAEADERQSGRLFDALRQRASSLGNPATDEQVIEVAEWLTSYVRATPDFFDEIRNAARAAGVATAVNPLLEEAERYFFIANDVLPDHLGLLGLIDDAYLGLRLVQLASEHAAESVGGPLVGVDLRVPNSVVRAILGEATARKLDAEIAPVADQLWFRTIMVTYSELPPGGLAFRKDPHPIYGTAGTRDMAKSFVGTMAID
jgi:hypothetical protein